VLDDVQLEVEVGRPDLRTQGSHAQSRQRDRIRHVALDDHEHHLEQRVPTEIPLRIQLLHQLLERNVLVVVGAERHLLHPTEQLTERRIPGQVRAHHEAVHEEPDDTFHLAARPVRDRGSHCNVVFSHPPSQEGLECGQERHEQRRAFPLAHVLEALQDLGREGQ
jgi:hypothetical protein